MLTEDTSQLNIIIGLNCLYILEDASWFSFKNLFFIFIFMNDNYLEDEANPV